MARPEQSGVSAVDSAETGDAMKNLIVPMAALVVLSFPALAQNNTLDPNAITVDSKRPQLQLSDQQRNAIQNALETENTEQKTPQKFEAKVGEAVPLTMTVDVMPESLVQGDPALKQYGYAKLAKDVLVIDPLKKPLSLCCRASPPRAAKIFPRGIGPQRAAAS